MGRGQLGSWPEAWWRVNDPHHRYDLMTEFMERAHLTGVRGGLYGMINLPSWMFLSSYSSMRAGLLAGSVISSLLHLGRGVFGSAFGSVAFVVAKQIQSSDSRGIYRRLFDTSSEVWSNAVIEPRSQERERVCYQVRQKELGP